MNAIRIVLTVCAVLFVSQSSPAQDASPIESDEAKVSYSAGVKLAESIKHGKDQIDLETLIKGLRDAFDGKKLAMRSSDIEKTFARFQETSPKLLGEKFLAKNASVEGVVELPSGLQYTILKEGTGKIPGAGDRVRAHYKGALLDGTVIENTYENGRPGEIGVYQVIVGWSEALQLMPVGSKWRLFIPSELAYGKIGKGKVVPPHSTVIFEVELLKILTDPFKNFQ